ncbi:phage protease [Aquipseudomonas alcaligenes]|uniref:Mu-like prophage I protein n=1 Tax=Aquipseudomonas alcaligenes TaxID=43263 RepID=A0A1N6ND41_AQUAC|nr:phage protease [Pseudomonas alcaligenes]SIP89990.1 Mu-like prophage I protein [Pseudomonas alcaligenes]
MKTKRLPLAVALAACSFELGKPDADNTIWLQVTPVGHFTPSDGREIKVPSWHIDQAVATKVIERFHARKNKRVVDYEHQTLLKEENGQPAPAAGWYQELEWREGQGLFAKVQLTARAAQYIADGEYQYFSPVFLYHPTTGDVLDVQMGALTNAPAIDGMQELSLRAAASFGLFEEPSEETPVNKLLLAICAALGLAETTTEEQAIAALSAHNTNLRKALGLDEEANGEAVLAACTGLKAKAATSVDPSKFVPVSVVEGLQGDIAALTARLGERDQKDLDSEIAAALEDGRLHKSMEDWARDLGKSDRAALTAYLEKAAPIAALARSQTGGEPPVPDEKTGLTSEELAVCSQMGLTADQFKAAKEA